MWSEKTRLATGKTGSAGKSGFGAFDQSILKQIEGILADKQRLINRTRIKRSNYRVLGCPMNVENTGKPTEKDEIKVGDVTTNKGFDVQNGLHIVAG